MRPGLGPACRVPAWWPTGAPLPCTYPRPAPPTCPSYLQLPGPHVPGRGPLVRSDASQKSSSYLPGTAPRQTRAQARQLTPGSQAALPSEFAPRANKQPPFSFSSAVRPAPLIRRVRAPVAPSLCTIARRAAAAVPLKGGSPLPPPPLQPLLCTTPAHSYSIARRRCQRAASSAARPPLQFTPGIPSLLPALRRPCSCTQPSVEHTTAHRLCLPAPDRGALVSSPFVVPPPVPPPTLCACIISSVKARERMAS